MNTEKKYCLDVWIGLAKIKSCIQNNPILNGAEKGYVSVVALAKNRIDYRRKVQASLKALNINLVRIEDVDLFSKRVLKYEVKKTIRKDVNDLMNYGDRVRFSTFHVYED